MRWYILGLLLFFVACSPEELVCSDPYINVDDACCLDEDANGNCDVEPEEEVAIDCSLCAPSFVTEKEEVIVYKYVCFNGEVVDDRSGCEERIESNAYLFTENKKQDETFIETFDSRPACRGKYKAAEIHIVPVTSASKITLQVMTTPNTAYEDLLELNSSRTILEDEYVYIGFCDDSDCPLVTDGQITADSAFLIRAEVISNGKRVFSRDRLIDPTPDGKYSQQNC